jgi:hypothetical protein
MSNTFTQVNASANQSEGASGLSLDVVLEEMHRWRQNKDPLKQKTIPDELWHKIFKLAKHYPPAKIRVLFAVSNSQYQKKFKQLYPNEVADESSEVDLCEVKTQSSVYRSFNIPASNTVIIEFIRQDGPIMRIHTTTDHFQQLIQAFFAGGNDAANHC